MDGWVGHVGWPIADGLSTKWSPIQLAVWRRIGKVRWPKPLCYAASRVVPFWRHLAVNGPTPFSSERHWFTQVFQLFKRAKAHSDFTYIMLFFRKQILWLSATNLPKFCNATPIKLSCWRCCFSIAHNLGHWCKPYYLHVAAKKCRFIRRFSPSTVYRLSVENWLEIEIHNIFQRPQIKL